MKVKLRGISKVAKESGLYLASIKLNDNTYVTGQGVIPGRPKTAGGLTLDEMSGKTPLSEEKAKKFPFIINPFRQYPFPDGYVFDDESPEGKAFLDLIAITASDRVAASKAEIRRGDHSFYLENKVRESKAKVNRFKKSVQAANVLNKLSTSEMLGVADYIYVHENDPLCNRDKEEDVIFGALYDYAQKKPGVLMNAMSPENKSWIRVAGFVTKGILNKRNGEYYEGNVFIAANFESLIDLYRTNIEKSTRWDKKYSELKRNIYSDVTEPILDITGIKSSFLEAVFNDDKEAIEKASLEIKKSGDESLMALLVKHISNNKPIENTTISSSAIIEIINNEPWMKAFSSFKAAYPDSELTKKKPILEFLKTQ